MNLQRPIVSAQVTCFGMRVKTVQYEHFLESYLVHCTVFHGVI